MLTQILTDAREMIRDAIAPYRFSDAKLIAYVNKAIREIRDKEPNSMLNANGTGLVAYADIPAVGNWTYMFTLPALDSLVSGLNGITGWNRITTPILYLSYSSSTKNISFHTDSARTALVAHATGCDSAGVKTIVADGTSGYAGTINVVAVPTDADAWYVTATEKALVTQAKYDRAIVQFIAHEVFNSDWDDAENTKRSGDHYNKFLTELYGDK